MRDILGVSISVGRVHNLHQVAAQGATDINQTQDLSQILVGLHDEIFHCNDPVLVGVDAHVNTDLKLTHFCSERRFETDTPTLRSHTAYALGAISRLLFTIPATR
ncbi:hypothetical protein [Nitrosospira sp. Nsp18]|uniref:hypothetical protein n=1 Tax=Nitrosospira sp. Nsp18 TaxID=1855334 RepID=UPI00115FC526|nr:hypothetical protein [Nitrosospira sp. Nsp18]